MQFLFRVMKCPRISDDACGNLMSILKQTLNCKLSKGGFCDMSFVSQFSVCFSIDIRFPQASSLILGHFITLKRNCILISTYSLCPPPCRLWQSLVYFLSLWLQLWAFCINGIIQYTAFCEWILPFSIMFSRFTCVVLRFFLWLISILWMCDICSSVDK